MSGSTTSTVFTIFNYTGKTETYTVPYTGLYYIEAQGAQGGSQPNYGGGETYYQGGKGADITGDFEVTQGEVLHIAAGGQGAGGHAGGGGGGSFVVGPGSTPLVIAGGGGGAGQVGDGGGGQTGTAGGEGGANHPSSGGTDGTGGSGTGYGGAGGGGFKSGGARGADVDGGGAYPGLQGGGNGGFGGGGGAGGGGGGGGGGYSGGGGGGTRGGGGGGSLDSGMNQVLAGGVVPGNGAVIIRLLSVPPPTLKQPTLTYTVAEGQTLQGLYGQILANVQATAPIDQASLTLTSIGEAGTAGFLYPDLSKHMLTYTADGYNPNKPTDSFTYTVADPDGGTVTGTVDVAVTGPSLPTKVGTAGPDQLATDGASQRLLGLNGNDSLVAAQSNALVFAGRGDDNVNVYAGGSGSTVYGGPGRNNVVIEAGAKDVSLVLQQGGVDQVTGFSVQNGDVLDLRQALAESQLNLGGDFGKLGSYARVVDSGGNARLLLYPGGIAPGGPAGIPLAELYGVGPSTNLATLINDHALAIT